MQEDVYQGDGLNLYAYCGNNPVVYYDPSGYAGASQQSGNGCPPHAQFGKDDNTNTDNVDESVTHTYYTVQNDSDAERLRGDDTP